jgi:hypothetical protein
MVIRSDPGKVVHDPTVPTVSGAPISRVAKSSLKQKTKFCLQILPHETKGTMNKMRLKQNEIGKILFLAQA